MLWEVQGTGRRRKTRPERKEGIGNNVRPQGPEEIQVGDTVSRTSLIWGAYTENISRGHVTEVGGRGSLMPKIGNHSMPRQADRTRSVFI